MRKEITYYYDDIPNTILLDIRNILQNPNTRLYYSNHCSENLINNFIYNHNSVKRRFSLDCVSLKNLQKSKIIKCEIKYNNIAAVTFDMFYSYNKKITSVIGFTREYKNNWILICITAYANFIVNNFVE